MEKLRFAVLGTGFWSEYQLSGWNEVGGAEPVAFYNRTLGKAKTLAEKFGVANCYDDVDELLARHAAELDFVDIITNVDTHVSLTKKVASYGLDVICQKPMAPKLHLAQEMISACKEAGVNLYIHENFRWQTPVRNVKAILDTGIIGKPFRSRVSFCSGFSVFDNQPFLKELPEFILMDIGSHILDICRFLFGEAKSVYCRTNRINPEIKGEDVADVLMEMKDGLSCYAEMSYASVPAIEPFPQTLIKVEGHLGTIELLHDYSVRTFTRTKSFIVESPPTNYSWADPDYAVVHASIVDCNRDILAGILKEKKAETTGDDNYETLRLVDAAYQSARENRVILLN